MEAATVRAESPPGGYLREMAGAHPAGAAFVVLGAIALILLVSQGLHDLAQATLDGMTLGTIYALGAVGLTLVYGILRLVNFAHGDFLTFGAYMAYLVNVTWGLPLVAAIFFAMATTALLGVLTERVMWRPMRAKGAGFLQLILMSLGLAFLIRSTVQWFWGSEIRTLEVNVTSSVEFLGLRIGQTELMVVIVGLAVLIAVGLMVRYSLLGKQMRALSDDIDLAETAGIDTRRVILYTWVFSGALAGLAGVLSGALTNLQPGLGFDLLLPIFAAVILGGIGNPFGALTGGPGARRRDRMVDPGLRAALEGDVRVRRPDHRPDHPAAGHLRPREGGMSMGSLPFAITFQALTDLGFWTGVLTIAGIYAVVTLGLQMNVGFTGLTNFGQAGFMAVGGYSMAILVLKAGFSFWLALPAAILITMAFGALVGLPALRLRSDYFAIVTLAMAEVVRLVAQNARGLTGGNEGLFCNFESSGQTCFDDSWRSVSKSILDFIENFWSSPDALVPLLIVVWVTVAIGTVALSRIQATPWGRVLRAVREDEDAARALGKNTLLYKVQSLAISAMMGALGGFFLALFLATIHPHDYEPIVTFYAFGVLILGGLANYKGVAVGAVLLWTVLEGTRFLDLPISEEKTAALRYAIVGLVLILLMAFRPQGLFGKREEMVLSE